MHPLQIPKGTQIFIGAPAQPFPAAVLDTLRHLVATSGISEAHVPRCFVPGVMEKPAQVLVVVTKAGQSHGEALNRIGQGVASALPPGEHLDVWPMDQHSDMLAMVRRAGCQTDRTEDKEAVVAVLVLRMLIEPSSPTVQTDGPVER
jgi:hypothetical protein